MKLKQKKQEVQQLEINPNDILEEEEKKDNLFVSKNNNM